MTLQNPSDWELRTILAEAYRRSGKVKWAKDIQDLVNADKAARVYRINYSASGFTLPKLEDQSDYQLSDLPTGQDLTAPLAYDCPLTLSPASDEQDRDIDPSAKSDLTSTESDGYLSPRSRKVVIVGDSCGKTSFLE